MQGDEAGGKHFGIHYRWAGNRCARAAGKGSMKFSSQSSPNIYVRHQQQRSDVRWRCCCKRTHSPAEVCRVSARRCQDVSNVDQTGRTPVGSIRF